MKFFNFFIFFIIIFVGFLVGRFLMADPDSPVTFDYSEFQLCTIPDSVFSGGCCSGAGSLPTLRWNLVVPDTLCDCVGGPITTVPIYMGVPTTVPGVADDCICGCGACTRDHSYQVSYWLEINKNNASFGSPELITGEVVSGVQSYHISPGELTNGLFYWRVGIMDQYGTVTDWSEEVASFSIPLDCTYVPGVGPGGSTALQGTEFGLCTAGNDPEPACYAGNFPTPTIRWNFSSVQNIWSDNNNLPLTTAPLHNTIPTDTPSPSQDVPVVFAATQAGYWIEVDDNNDFSSPEYQTDFIVSTDEFHKICSDALEFITTYYWRVAVEDSRGSRANPVWAEHNPGSFTTAPNCAPAEPTDLETETAVQPLACMYMEVHWTDNSYNEEGFLVQRSVTGLGGWVDVCDVSANINSCVAIMPDSTTWYFRVRSYNTTGGPSAWEPVAGTGTGGTDGIAGTTSDYCTPGLAIVGYNCDCINIAWAVTGDETGVDHYRIERSVEGGAWQILVASHPQGVMFYNDCDIDSGIIEYEYRVTAYEDAGETIAALSNIVKVDDPCPDLPSWWEDK